MSEERYRSLPGALRLGVGAEQELVETPLLESGALVPAWCAKLLAGVGDLRSLDEHVRHLAAEVGADADEIGSLRQGLQRLVEARALVSERALSARVLGHDLEPETPPRIARLGLPTRDRPELLERAITSYAENARAHGRRIEIVVADDAPTAEARATARARLAALARRLDAPIAYAGLEEKLAYSEALANASGAPPELVRFGLVNTDTRHFGAGANRNVLLLQGVGDLLLLADDDTVCRVGDLPDREPGTAFSSDDDPMRFWFPDPGQDALETVTFGPADHFAQHEALLGRRAVSALHPGPEGPLRLDRLGWSAVRRLRPERSRVALTLSGVVGDSGVGSPAFLLFLGGRSRERLHRSESVFRQAIASRRLVRGVTCPTVADSAFCMGLNMGIDLGGFVPPFMPLERNEDGVFGAALRATRQDTFFGFLPSVIAHLPPEPRGHTLEGVWQSLRGNNANDMLVAMMRTELGEGVAATEGAVSRLASQLSAWASLEVDDLAAIVRASTLRDRVRRMFELEERLRAFDRTPTWWAEAAEGYLSATRGALTDPAFAAPRDLAGAFGPDQAWQVFRTMLRRYGELLAAWPSLLDHARILGTRGERPARLL